MLKETWKPISGYENLYIASNYGNVKSLDRIDTNNRIRKGKLLKPRVHSGGYLRVQLSKDGKQKDFYIHRIVCELFVSNPCSYQQVNHIDGNKENNYIENLEWVSCEYNIRHAFQNGLNKSPKAMLGKFGKDHNRSKAIYQYSMNGEFIKEYGSISEAQRHTGIDKSSIIRCCKRKQKKAGNYIWKYNLEIKNT